MHQKQIIAVFFAIIMLTSVTGAFSIEPAFAALSTRLTLGGLHTNYDRDELIFFTGKLVGSDGYAIAGAKIWIMEDDTVTWQTITTTTTNARGEFNVKVNAAFWDGSDSKVEVFAYYEGNSFNKFAKSVTKDMYIHQLRYVAPKIEQDRTITSVRGTSISLQVIDGTSPQTLRVFPTFTDYAGNPIPTSKISIYVDGQYKQKVSSNNWSTSLRCGEGSHTVKAVSDTIVFGVNTYQSSSTTESFYCKPPQVITSTPKQYTQTKPIQPKISSIQIEEKIPKDSEFKANAEEFERYDAQRMKEHFSSVMVDLQAGIKIAENSLSGLVYQSPEAQKKIEDAWKIRWTALQKVNDAETNWNAGVMEIKKQNYKNANTWFEGVNLKSQSIEDDLKWISKAIADAEKLEEEHKSQGFLAFAFNSGEGKTCFLFFCW